MENLIEMDDLGVPLFLEPAPRVSFPPWFIHVTGIPVLVVCKSSAVIRRHRHRDITSLVLEIPRLSASQGNPSVAVRECLLWVSSELCSQKTAVSKKNKRCTNPSKIEWDLTNGPLSKLLELLDTQVEGSVQWVLLEISWNQTKPPNKKKLLKKNHGFRFLPKVRLFGVKMVSGEACCPFCFFFVAP